MQLLEANGVAKQFSGVIAVKYLDLVVNEGELLGLFGPNGAGKTTMFNLIAGAIYPDAGRIYFGGNEITRLPAFRRARLGIGRTFQIVRPFRTMTVLDNLLAAVPSERTLTNRLPIDPLDLLRKVGLEERANHLAGTLTLGMLKRLEVARALALSPRLLLLDEPLAGLSDRESRDIIRFIEAIRQTTTIIMVEHNVQLALRLCDRAVVLDAGELIAEGPPELIRNDPAVIRAYLGEDRAQDA